MNTNNTHTTFTYFLLSLSHTHTLSDGLYLECCTSSPIFSSTSHMLSDGLYLERCMWSPIFCFTSHTKPRGQNILYSFHLSLCLSHSLRRLPDGCWFEEQKEEEEGGNCSSDAVQRKNWGFTTRAPRVTDMEGGTCLNILSSLLLKSSHTHSLTHTFLTYK